MEQRDLAEKDYWDSVYGLGAPAVGGGWTPFTYDALTLEHILLAAIDRCGPDTVLEVGCADSTWLPYLAKKRNFKVSGIDYSEPGCALARARLKAEGVPGTVLCRNLFEADPEEIGRHDLVYSLGVVEHFSDLEDVLARLLEFVKPGGTLLTEVPNLVSVHGLMSWVYQPGQFAKHRLITRTRLDKAYRNLGMERIESAYAGLFSLNVVAWGRHPRFPRVDGYLVPLARKAVRYSDSVLRRLGTHRGLPGFSPFLYAIGRKPP